MKKILSILIVMLSTLTCWAQNWTAPDQGAFETSTILNFDLKLNDELISESADIQVAAFIGNECRGLVTANSSRVTTSDGKNIVYTQLMVYGHPTEIGKDIELRTYVSGLYYVLFDQSRVGYKFDGETHGTLSQMNHIALWDLTQCELTMPDIHLDLNDNRDSEPIEKLLEVVWSAAGAGTGQKRVAFADLICRPLQSSLGVKNKYPIYTVTTGTFDNLFRVHALTATHRKGETMDITFDIPYWHSLTTSCQVFIEPFDYLDEDVRLRVDDITLQKGETIDLREKIRFLFPAEDWTEAQPHYDEVPYDQLHDRLGYDTPMHISVAPTSSGHYEWNPSDNTLTGTKSTNEAGTPLTVTIDFEAKGITLSDEARVYVEPFNNFDNRTTLIFDDIEILRGQSVDLRDYAYFFFPRTGEFVQYHDLHQRFGYVPEFNSRASRPYCCTVDGFTLTGKIFQTQEPVDICFYTDDGEYTYWGQVYVTVKDEDYYVALEDLQVELPAVIPRYETIRVPLTITPADANLTDSQFTFTDDSRSSYGGEGWESAECHIVRDADTWMLEVTPLVFGPVNLTITYRAGDRSLQLVRPFAVPVDQPLRAGWGWYTINCHGDEVSLATLDAELFGGTILDIRSQDATNYKDETYGFYGDLTTIKRTEGIKVKSLAAADSRHYYPLTVSEYPSLHQSTTITVHPGWNWIAYPYQYNHPLRTIAAMLPKAEGNRLATYTNGFAECDGEYWYGSIDTMAYGEGVMFYNATDTPATITMPAERTMEQGPLPALGPLPPPSPIGREPLRSRERLAPRFPNTMTIVATFADAIAAEDLEVIPFVGQESRGESRVVTTGNGQRLFITVYGQPGERVTFRLYDGYGEYPLDTRLTFEPAAGTLRHPVVLQTPEALNGIVGVHAEETTPSDVYDLSGRRISQPHTHGLYIQGGKKVKF